MGRYEVVWVVMNMYPTYRHMYSWLKINEWIEINGFLPYLLSSLCFILLPNLLFYSFIIFCWLSLFFFFPSLCYLLEALLILPLPSSKHALSSFGSLPPQQHSSSSRNNTSRSSDNNRSSRRNNDSSNRSCNSNNSAAVGAAAVQQQKQHQQQSNRSSSSVATTVAQ